MFLIPGMIFLLLSWPEVQLEKALDYHQHMNVTYYIFMDVLPYACDICGP